MGLVFQERKNNLFRARLLPSAVVRVGKKSLLVVSHVKIPHMDTHLPTALPKSMAANMLLRSKTHFEPSAHY